MKNKRSRTQTRIYAMEVLYQWLHTASEVDDIISRYQEKPRADAEYLVKLVKGCLSKRREIDQAIQPFLEERSLEEISQIEYAILLVGAFELMNQFDVPYRVVINEAINLAKQYGAVDSHKFVNSVLDRLAKSVRGIECQGS